MVVICWATTSGGNPQHSGTSDGTKIIDALLKELTTKLQLLDLKWSKSQAVTDKTNVETVKHHRDNLKTLARQADELKVKIEQARLTEGGNLDDVSTWSVEIKEKLETVDIEVAHLAKWLDEAEYEASLATQESKEAFLAKERKQQFDFEGAQHELKFEYEKKAEELRKTSNQQTSKTNCAKLPKLSITKFDGTFE